MDTLKDILIRTLKGYTGKGLNGYSYLVADAEERYFIVVGVGIVQGTRIVETDLIVRLDGNRIIIERDQNDKILMDALVQAGVPREAIIVAYAGEPAPEVSF